MFRCPRCGRRSYFKRKCPCPIRQFTPSVLTDTYIPTSYENYIPSSPTFTPGGGTFGGAGASGSWESTPSPSPSSTDSSSTSSSSLNRHDSGGEVVGGGTD